MLLVDQDVQVELRSLGTTGGHKIWNASKVMLEFLKKKKFTLSNALELGSGTGWLGLSVVKQFDDCMVTFSEQEAAEAQSLLNHNIFELNKPLAARCRVEVLDFFDEKSISEMAHKQWTLLFGADLVPCSSFFSLFFSFFFFLGLYERDCHYASQYDRQAVERRSVYGVRAHVWAFRPPGQHFFGTVEKKRVKSV
jgi:hypothetical protein